MSFRIAVKAYETGVEKEKQVEKDTFFDIVKLLTMRGVSKADLSTYKNKFRHCKDVLLAMLKRTGELQFGMSSNTNLITRIKQLKDEWMKNCDFLTWNYGKHHLKLTECD